MYAQNILLSVWSLSLSNTLCFWVLYFRMFEICGHIVGMGCKIKLVDYFLVIYIFINIYFWHIFFYLGFLSLDIHEPHDNRERGRPILTFLYHLHSLCEYVDIKWTIATERFFLDIASDRSPTWNLWFLRARFIHSHKNI